MECLSCRQGFKASSGSGRGKIQLQNIRKNLKETNREDRKGIDRPRNKQTKLQKIRTGRQRGVMLPRSQPCVPVSGVAAQLRRVRTKLPASQLLYTPHRQLIEAGRDFEEPASPIPKQPANSNSIPKQPYHSSAYYGRLLGACDE